MASVMLTIGGREYTLACRDGGENHLRRLAARVDAKVREASASVGHVTETRQMLFAALLLADEVEEARPPESVDAAVLEALAARIEALADRLTISN